MTDRAFTLSTARLGWKGADRLDITLGQVEPDPVGLLLAPSRPLLDQGLRLRHEADDALAEARRAQREGMPVELAATAIADAERMVAAAWAWYEPRYLGEKRAAYRANPAVFDPVLARGAAQGTLCFLCFCVDAGRCHRTLAAQLLAAVAPRRGYEVTLVGERAPAPDPQTTLALG